MTRYDLSKVSRETLEKFAFDTITNDRGYPATAQALKKEATIPETRMEVAEELIRYLNNPGFSQQLQEFVKRFNAAKPAAVIERTEAETKLLDYLHCWGNQVRAVSGLKCAGMNVLEQSVLAHLSNLVDTYIKHRNTI